MDNEKIKEQAKKIMDDFMLALDKVKDVEESFGVNREEDIRETALKKESKDQEGFRNRMFKNASKIKDDCIVAEKKSW